MRCSDRPKRHRNKTHRTRSCIGKHRGLAYDGTHRRRSGLEQCASCANFDNATTRATCLRCIGENAPNGGCSVCVWEQRWPYFEEKCLTCAAAGAPDTILLDICSECVHGGNSIMGGTTDAERCVACATAPRRSWAARAGCSHCHLDGIDAAGAQACLACIDAVPNTPAGAR